MFTLRECGLTKSIQFTSALSDMPFNDTLLCYRLLAVAEANVMVLLSSYVQGCEERPHRVFWRCQLTTGLPHDPLLRPWIGSTGREERGSLGGKSPPFVLTLPLTVRERRTKLRKVLGVLQLVLSNAMLVLTPPASNVPTIADNLCSIYYPGEWYTTQTSAENRLAVRSIASGDLDEDCFGLQKLDIELALRMQVVLQVTDTVLQPPASLRNLHPLSSCLFSELKPLHLHSFATLHCLHFNAFA